MMTRCAFLLLALPALVAAVSSTSTRSTSESVTPTKTASATVVSPSFTPSASSFPSLTVEQWGVYDISPTSADPTQLLPVFLLRSQIDNQLYLEFVNYVDPATNPPTSEWAWWGAVTKHIAAEGCGRAQHL